MATTVRQWDMLALHPEVLPPLRPHQQLPHWTIQFATESPPLNILAGSNYLKKRQVERDDL